MLGKIETYRAKSGRWRWRFYERNTVEECWDIRAVGTEEYFSDEAAELDARHIIVNSWGVEIDKVVDSGAERPQIKTLTKIMEWIKALVLWCFRAGPR
jgi:hypothetical protein